MTYSAICDSYVDYVECNYKNSVVLFDGYEGGPSTKDTAHLRRTGGCTSTVLDANFEKGSVSKK